MPIYYPSAVVEIALRFQEPVGQAGQQAVARSLDPTPQPSGQPMAEMRQDDPADPYSWRMVCQPLDARWEVNTAREADTCMVRLPFADLPFDPRSIRSAVLGLYLGTVTADDFAAGIGQRSEPAQGRRSYIRRTKENLRFLGHTDEWRLELGDNGDELTLEARDFTALLIDHPVPTDVLRSIRYGRPLDEVVAELVHSLPSCASMPVQSEDADDRPLEQQALRHVLGAGGKTRSGEAKGVQTTYWDLVTDLCLLSGVVPVIVRDMLWLRSPRSLYVDRPVEAATMVWGGNIKEMRLSRRFGRTKVQPIEVRCFDPVAKITAAAKYPDEQTAKAEATPSGRGGSVTYQVKVVHGVQAAQLPRIAEALYLELAHQQLEATISTEDMASFGGDNSDPDLLELQAGDPLNILVRDIANPNGRLPLFRPALAEEIRSSSPAELAERLRRRGMKPSVASQLALALRQASRLATFRVRSCSHKLHHEQGYSCTIETSSFAEVPA